MLDFQWIRNCTAIKNFWLQPEYEIDQFMFAEKANFMIFSEHTDIPRTSLKII